MHLRNARTLYTVRIGALSERLFYIAEVVAQRSSKEQLMRTLSKQPIDNMRLLLGASCGLQLPAPHAMSLSAWCRDNNS